MQAQEDNIYKNTCNPMWKKQNTYRNLSDAKYRNSRSNTLISHTFITLEYFTGVFWNLHWRDHKTWLRPKCASWRLTFYFKLWSHSRFSSKLNQSKHQLMSNSNGFPIWNKWSVLIQSNPLIKMSLIKSWVSQISTW